MSARAEVSNQFQTSILNDGVFAVAEVVPYVVSGRGKGSMSIKMSAGGSDKVFGNMPLNSDVVRTLTVCAESAASPNTAEQVDKSDPNNWIYYTQVPVGSSIEFTASVSGNLAEDHIGGTAQVYAGIDRLFASSITRTGGTATTAPAMKSYFDDITPGEIQISAKGSGHTAVIWEA